VRLADTFARAQQRYANLLVRGAKDSEPPSIGAMIEQARRDVDEAERALSAASGTFL
jgi:hypothetical protein